MAEPLTLEQQRALALARARRRRAEAQQPQQAQQPPRANAPVDAASDVALAVRQGAQNIPGIIAGTPGTTRELALQFGTVPVYWAERLKGKTDAEARQTAQTLMDFTRAGATQASEALAPLLPGNTGPAFYAAMHAPTADQLTEATSDLTGFRHVPQTPVGRYAQVITEFLPLAATGNEASIPTRLARAAAPAVAQEAVGQAAHRYAPSLEVPARLATAIVTGRGMQMAENAAADARFAGAQRRYQQNQTAIANQQLANEVAPMTLGERTGNLDQIHAEQQMRMGASASTAETQARLQGFDLGRAEQIQARVLNGIGERNGAQPWEGEPIAGDLESAGNDLANALRSNRRSLFAQANAQYARTWGGLQNEPVARAGNTSVVEDIADSLRRENIPYDVLPGNTRARLAAFQKRLDGGEVLSQADVERLRQDLNGEMGAAMRSGGMQERDMAQTMRAFDDWRAGTLFQEPIRQLRELGIDTTNLEQAAIEGARARNIAQSMNSALAEAMRANRALADPRIVRAMGAIRERINLARDLEQSRSMYAEAANMFGERIRAQLSSNEFGDAGRVDLGGRQLANIIEAERSGERIMRKIFGNLNGSLPESTLALMQRLRAMSTGRISYTNRVAASGVRTPGRQSIGADADPLTLDARLTTARRFMADTPQSQYAQTPMEGRAPGVQLPTAELQAVRRGYLRILVEELTKYVETGREGAPARLLPIDTLANKFNRALTGEGRRITELLFTDSEIAGLERVRQWLNRARPPTGSRPVSSPAAHRAAWRTLRNLLTRIPVVGPIAEELGIRQTARRAAERAIRQPRNLQPQPAPVRPQPATASPAMAGALAAASVPQGGGPLGAAYGLGDEPPRRRLGQP